MMLFKKTRKGQSLLIVVVMSALALLILISMADRLLIARTNVQRNVEFERSLAAAENKANRVIGVLYNSNQDAINECLSLIPQGSQDFVLLDCPLIRLENDVFPVNAKVYARRSGSELVAVDARNPTLLLKLTDEINRGVPVSSVSIKCSNPNVHVLVTRAYLEGSLVKVDKGIVTNCNPNNYVVVNLFNRDDQGSLVPANVEKSTLYIGAKVIRGGDVSVGIRASNSSGLVSSTQKYEFMVTGLGGLDGTTGLGSDVVITFEKGAGGTVAGLPSHLFDYVYFQESNP